MTKAEQPTITLLPCPFCGGEGLSHRVPRLPKLYRIACKNCDAGPSARFDSYQAIAAWNTRTTSLAAQDGLVEAVTRFMPTNINLDNANVSDKAVVPLDVTVGELRAISAALSAIKGDKS